MKVTEFFRRRRACNDSIEKLFQQIAYSLPGHMTAEKIELSFFSSGVINRLRLILEARRKQGAINHITGDVNFIALGLPKQRTILTVHDLGLLSHPNRMVRFLLKLFWITLPVRCSRIITTVSQATKEQLLKNVSVDPATVHVIHNPVDDCFVRVPKPFNASCPTILQIGTKYNKNVSRLIDALRDIPCRLEIVGQLSSEQSRQLEKSGIPFTAFSNLSQSQMVDRYVQADIVSFVSTNEGFGLPIVEANRIGRVVVTSNLSSMPEIAGGSAHLVNPHDVSDIRSGIMKVTNDATYREALISKGYENANRFSVTAIVDQYVRLYESIHASR